MANSYGTTFAFSFTRHKEALSYDRMGTEQIQGTYPTPSGRLVQTHESLWGTFMVR